MSGPNGSGDLRIDVAQWERSKNWVGVTIVTIIGVAAFVSAVSGHGVLGGTGIRIVVGILGALFLIGGGAGIIAGFRGPHQEYVTVGPRGLALSFSPDRIVGAELGSDNRCALRSCGRAPERATAGNRKPGTPNQR